MVSLSNHALLAVSALNVVVLIRQPCLCYQQSAAIIGATLIAKKAAAGRLRSTTRRAGRGRPPVHVDSWSKVSVVLFDRQIAHLDRVATDMHGRSGRVFNRAEIIRALIDGVIDSGMDITGAGSEADLRARVARRLGSPAG